MLLRHRSLAYLFVLASAGLMLAVAPARADYEDVFSSGHGDIGVTYDASVSPNTFELEAHLGLDAVVNGTSPPPKFEYEPNELAVRVLSAIGRPAGPEWDFIGTASGNPFYFLSQSNIPGTPRFGFATEELNPAEWTGPITWTLQGVSGPGQVSLWQTSIFSTTPQVRWSSTTGVNAFQQGAIGGHDDYSWGFSAAGTYDVTVGASLQHVSNGLVTGSATYRFLVGPQQQAVPEPSSLALIGLGLGVSLFVGARSRKRSSPVAKA